MDAARLTAAFRFAYRTGVRAGCCVLAFLCCTCFSAPTLAPVQEYNWTVKTSWGPVGVYKLSYSSPEASLSSLRTGYIQLCVGPLGKLTLGIDTAASAAQLRAIVPVVIAIVVFGSVALAHRRKPTEILDAVKR